MSSQGQHSGVFAAGKGAALKISTGLQVFLYFQKSLSVHALCVSLSQQGACRLLFAMPTQPLEGVSHGPPSTPIVMTKVS